MGEPSRGGAARRELAGISGEELATWLRERGAEGLLR